MARAIIWTQSALNDLEAAAEYISKDSPRYASSFVQEVRDAARSLNTLAFRGRVVPEIGDANIRELILKSYRLIYHVTTQKIYVLGLVHGAREVWTLHR